ADPEAYDFYVITAWSLPFTFNLDAYWTEDATPLAGDVVTDTVLAAAPAPPASPPRAGSAYLFSNASEAGARLAFGLLAEGFKVAIGTQPPRADGVRYPRGPVV